MILDLQFVFSSFVAWIHRFCNLLCFCHQFLNFLRNLRCFFILKWGHLRTFWGLQIWIDRSITYLFTCSGCSLHLQVLRYPYFPNSSSFSSCFFSFSSSGLPSHHQLQATFNFSISLTLHLSHPLGEIMILQTSLILR